MERYKLTADQAFKLLAQASMAANRKLRDIADHLVATGELVSPPPRTDHRPTAQSAPGPAPPGMA